MKQFLVNFTFYLVARSLHATYRYRFHQTGFREEAERGSSNGAFALALWHRNSFVGTLSHTFQKFRPLCSRSGDGQMVAFLCQQMGLRPVLGSSSRGGKEARDEMMEGVAEGWGPAITVDGPKGPPLKSKNGIIDVAKKTGIPILPMTAVADRYWQLGSWDRLRIPKPFARIVVTYAPPIRVPADAEGEAFEALRQKLDDSLNRIDEEAPQVLATSFGEGKRIDAYFLVNGKS